jgi:transcriptional/translational regulatory protein YebC/TACO1
MNEDREWKANEGTEIEISENDIEKLEKLVELFEESDDITDVYTNAV